MSLPYRSKLPRWRALAAAVAGCFAVNLAHAQTTGGQANHDKATITQQGSRTITTTANPGGGAVVDTAGFTASIVGISQADALSGRLRVGSAAGAAPGLLAAPGRVVARGADVVLIATQPDTGAPALVDSVGGDTMLAAGQEVDITGRGMEGIRMQLRAPGDRAANLGTLMGDPVGVFVRQLQHRGMIHAQSATLVGGRVFLTGGESSLVTGHTREASAPTGGADPAWGGLVLTAAKSIDVGGLHRGTDTLPGGGVHADHTRLANARHMDIEAGVLLRADATWSGPGGTAKCGAGKKPGFGC